MWYKFVHSEDITIEGDRVLWHIRHIEFEPAGSAVAPNPAYFKNGIRFNFLGLCAVYIMPADILSQVLEAINCHFENYFNYLTDGQ